MDDQAGHTDRGGRSALHYAALTNDITHVRALLAADADPNSQDQKGFTPLHFAAQEYALEVAALLLEHGADIDRVNIYGNTPLFTAVFNSQGRGEMIGLLRSHGADVHKANRSGQTPLGLAILIANYDVQRFFVDVDTKNVRTFSVVPLHESQGGNETVRRDDTH